MYTILTMLTIQLPIFTQSTAVLSLKIFPQDSQLVDSETGQVLTPDAHRAEWTDFYLHPGPRLFEIRREGYQSKFLTLPDIQPRQNLRLDEKLEPLNSRLHLLSELPTGSQPKSVIFTPDGDHILVAQLNGPGYDIYRSDPPEFLRSVTIPEWGRYKGFVEWALLPKTGEIWLSQMTAGRIHVISQQTLDPVSSFSTKGEWSKVITVDANEEFAYVSNWLSENISVVDVADQRVVAYLESSGTPRGMVIHPGGNLLYAGIYEGDGIDVFDLQSRTRLRTLKTGYGAKRHMALDASNMKLYISDMYHGDIWIYDLATEKLLSRTPVAPKLNTIALSPDGEFLFISSRGRNNPESYLLKGPDFGTITVLDTKTMEEVDGVWGRNQPTGLALDPEGTLLATTDFLDQNLELFDVSALYSDYESATASGSE